MTASVAQLAAAIERGDVARVSIVCLNPDRLAAELLEAGATPLSQVTEREALSRGSRVRWRQGSLVVGGTHVSIASDFSPVQRDPRADVSADEWPSLVELGGEAGGA